MMLDLHLHDLSDFLEESKEETTESKEKVVLVSWSSFVTDYIVLGKVDLLILDCVTVFLMHLLLFTV